MPEFESPVTATPASPEATVTLTDESATTKVLVRSDQPQFDLAFGRISRRGGCLVAATRPDEWLLLGSADAVAAAQADIDRGGFTSVIPFTHGRALLRLTGADATSVLAKVCGLDWSDTMTPDGAVVSGSVALTTCDIIRDDQAGDPSYLLMLDRSFGQYLYDALHDAAAEYGSVLA